MSPRCGRSRCRKPLRLARATVPARAAARAACPAWLPNRTADMYKGIIDERVPQLDPHALPGYRTDQRKSKFEVRGEPFCLKLETGFAQVRHHVLRSEEHTSQLQSLRHLV